MRYRALDINLLVVLDVLLDSSSVTRTGEALGLSQPAISSALGRLRDHFGDELLVSAGRTNLKTPLAEQIRAPLKTLLAEIDSLISLRAGFNPKTEARRFSVVASEYVVNVLGHDILRSIANAGTSLRLEMLPVMPESLDQFERGEIEMAILPSQYAIPGYPSIGLWDDHFVCVVWKDHPSIGETLSMEDYLRARHVVRIQPKGQRLTVIDQWFLNQSSLRRDIAAELPAFTDLLNALVGTPLVATIQRRLADNYVGRLPIRILPSPIDFPKLPIVLQWQSHLSRDEGLCWFKDLVSEISGRMTDGAATDA